MVRGKNQPNRQRAEGFGSRNEGWRISSATKGRQGIRFGGSGQWFD